MKRLRAVRRKMSWAAFERLPHRLGWKHEYWDGMARLRPSWSYVTYELELAPRVPGRRRGIRPVCLADQSALRQPFLEAFALAPEYVGYPMAKFREAADKYLVGYFGDVRGEPSPVSVVAEVRGEIIGAALVKERAKGPLLDCIYVRPDHGRKGWATALAAHAVNGLLRRGATVLYSGALLANPVSLAWHARLGFRERPDLWIARARWRHCYSELKRRDTIGDLTPEERADFERQIAVYEAGARRLEARERQDFRSAHPLLD
jgi:GNAT superfamily N-acetyltransferase